MDTAQNTNQNLSSQQITQRVLDLFNLNEDFEQAISEVNQWNELLFKEQSISLRNQLIANIELQQSSQMQESLQNERNEIQKQTKDFKQAKLILIRKAEKLFDNLINSLFQKKANLYYTIGFYDEIPISFNAEGNLTKIQNDQEEYYQVKGTKDIFSIQRIPINPQKKYKLELEIRNNSDWQSFVGHRPFYQNQHVIVGHQIRVFQQTEVKLIGLDMENHAFIVDNFNNNLSRWNSPDKPFCEKYIGFYLSGCINAFIKNEEVITTKDKEIAAYKEIDVLNNKIYLTDWGWDYYINNLHSQTKLNQTALMNHGGTGIYVYSELIQKNYKDWVKKSYDINSFRRFTDHIDICILANFEGTQDKVFEFKNVKLFVCNDEND
ncbi:hypothetical protein ABPG74_009249 [Tetrahymena malaccensis]